MKLCGLCLLFIVGVSCAGMSGDIGVGMGMVQWEASSNQNFWIAINYRMTFKSHLVIEPEVGYGNESKSETRCDDETCLQTEFNRRDTDLALHTLYSIQAASMRLSFGGGPGVHFLNSKFSISANEPHAPIPFDISFSRNSTKVGVHFLAELDVPIWRKLSAYAAIRNELVQDANNNFKLYGGTRLALP